MQLITSGEQKKHEQKKKKKQNSRTLDVFDFSSAETRKSPPVLGARDACWADSSLDVHKGSSSGGATLASGQGLLGRHGGMAAGRDG